LLVFFCFSSFVSLPMKKCLKVMDFMPKRVCRSMSTRMVRENVNFMDRGLIGRLLFQACGGWRTRMKARRYVHVYNKNENMLYTNICIHRRMKNARELHSVVLLLLEREQLHNWPRSSSFIYH
jgi:hypothetical protein